MKVLVILAKGFEEIEAVTPIDVLRRAGAEVTVAGLTAESVLGSRGISIIPDARLDAVAHEDYDLVVLPGGMPGATNLKNDATVKAVLKKAIEADRTVGAICASPAVVLDSHGFLKNRRATCHPARASEMTEGTLTDDRVSLCPRGRVRHGHHGPPLRLGTPRSRRGTPGVARRVGHTLHRLLRTGNGLRRTPDPRRRRPVSPN